LFHDGVASVITLGVAQGERGVGKRGVVTPGVEELALAGRYGVGVEGF